MEKVIPIEIVKIQFTVLYVGIYVYMSPTAKR